MKNQMELYKELKEVEDGGDLDIQKTKEILKRDGVVILSKDYAGPIVELFRSAGYRVKDSVNFFTIYAR